MQKTKINHKFKGLINGKVWKSGSFQVYDNDLAVINVENMPYYVFKESVSRFTGFVNSLGEEIYEGDLLASKEKEVQLVLWDEGHHQWKVGSSPLEDSLLSSYLEDCLNKPIVGHIFTHQHLLRSPKAVVNPRKGNKLVKH